MPGSLSLFKPNFTVTWECSDLYHPPGSTVAFFMGHDLSSAIPMDLRKSLATGSFCFLHRGAADARRMYAFLLHIQLNIEKVGFLRRTRTPILSEEGNCATTGGKTQLLLTARAS